MSTILSPRQRIDAVLPIRFTADSGAGGVMTLSGGNFWPDTVPEGVGYPRIVWLEIANENTRIIPYERILDRTTIWIDCVTNDPRSRKSADDLFAAVNAIVEGLSDYTARPHILKAVQKSQRRFVDPHASVRYNHSGAVYVFHNGVS